MLSLRRVILTVVAVTFIGTPAAFAQNAFYTYIAATDTSAASRFSDVSTPVIGGNGDVAFAASVRNGGSGIYKWSAATHQIVTIYEDLVDRNLFDGSRFAFPAIDGAGRVFFQLDSAVMAGSGGGLTTVADSSFTVPLGSNPGPYSCLNPRLMSRSASGAGVLVSCELQSGIAGGGAGRGVYLADGGGLSRICDVDTSNFFTLFPRCFLPGAEVASNGVVGGLSIGISGSGAEANMWVPARGDAAGIEKLLDPAAATAFWPYAFLASPFAISRSGRLVYMAYQPGPTATQSGYAITSIDTAFGPVHVTDPRNGVYRDAISPSINDLDEVAFADTVRHGLFAGPDPALDRVLGQSDHLPGYSAPVVDVAFTHPGLNLTGSLAFLTFLSDGTIVVTVAQRFNQPPVITNPGNQSTPEGSAVTLHIDASDPENDLPLRYGLVSPVPAPNGTIGGVPPGITPIDTAGYFTGTPAPGTSGSVYAVTVRVTDARGASSDMSFTWTITPPVPAARTQLTATANLAAQGIDLTWQNPAGDTATTIDVDISQTGPGGPYQNWQILPAGSTAFQFVIGGNDPNFCFKVRGSSPAGIGPYSNFGCANYPQLVISHQPPLPNTTSVLIPLTTNMPATLSVPNPPAGSVVGINVLSPTSFQIAISNLSAATAYTVRVAGESIPVRRDATHDVSFTTPSTGGSGGGSGGFSSSLLTGRVESSVIQALSGGQDQLVLGVRLTNTDARAVLDNLRMPNATTLDMYCPPASNQCFDTFNTYPVGTRAPASLNTLGPGQSSLVTLTFVVDDYVLQGFQGLFGSSNILHLKVTFDERGAPPSRDVVLDLPVSARQDPDVALETFTAEALGADSLKYTFTVRNLGPGIARGIRVRLFLPPFATFVPERIPTPCSLPRNSDYVICDIPDLGGSQATGYPVTFDVSRVPDAAVVTTAIVSANRDPNLTNNSGTLVTPVGVAVGTNTDLAITIDDVQDPVQMLNGGAPNTEFIVTVTNQGPEGAANVRVQLDGSIRLDPFQAISHCFIAPNPGAPRVCQLGDMAAGASVQLRLVGWLTLPGAYLTTVAVTSGAIDPDARNNVDSELTFVAPSLGGGR